MRVEAFVQALRQEGLYKHRDVAKTLDWAAALGHLRTEELDVEAVERTLGLLFKY